MQYIFGYGSLINPISVSETLGRKVKLTPAILNNHYRTWTASVNVITSKGLEQARFLDLSNENGTFCNGVVFQIYDYETKYLDCREQGYSKKEIDISTFKEHKPKTVTATTYLMTDNCKSSTGSLPTKYKAIVEKGLSHYNKSFKQTFLSTTEIYCGKYMKDKYRFN